MSEKEPEPEPISPFSDYPPNLEAIRQAIRDQGIQDQLEISYEDLEERELI